MNVLVTGGNGFLGEKVVKELKRRRQKITVFDKNKGKDEKVKYVRGDVTSIRSLARAFKDIDIVYHLAAVLDEHDPNLWDVNVEGTKTVVKLCENNDVSQLVFTSSSGVLGESIIPAKEPFPYNPKTKYEKSKAQAERVIRASDVPYTIVRGSILVGPNQIWKTLFEKAKDGFPIIGNGKNHMHLTSFYDFVDVLMEVRDNDDAKNEVFNVATSDLPKYRDVFEFINLLVNKNKSSRRIPAFLAYIYSYLNLAMSKIKGEEQKLLYRKETLDRLLRDRKLNTEKVEKILDVNLESTWESLEKTYEKIKEG
mgnify:CR=1 FL=1